MLPREPQRENKRYEQKPNDKFLKENEDILKKYCEKIRGTEELTIIETGDPREVIEKDKKELEKKEKEVELDMEDLPKSIKDEDILELLAQMEIDEQAGESAKEKEQPLPTNPIGLQPMEEVIQENVPNSEMQVELSAEELSLRKEKEKQERLEQGLEYTFPVRNILTTSEDGIKDEYDLKYIKVRFIFDTNISLYVQFDMSLTQKESKTQEVINGIITDVLKKRIFSNTNYFIRIWNGNTYTYENIQNDVAWAKKCQGDDNMLISGSKQNTKIKKQITPENLVVQLTLQNTINKKRVDASNELDLLKQHHELQRDIETLRKRVRELPEVVFRGESSKDYRTSELPLILFIQLCGAEKYRENGAPYRKVEEYLKDFGKSAEELKTFFVLSDVLEPFQKQEACNLVDEYIIESRKENAPIFKQLNYDIMQGRGEKLVQKYQNELFKLERGIRGTEFVKEEIPKFELGMIIPRGSTRGVKEISLKIKCENWYQHQKIEELFTSRLVAITVHTDKYPISMVSMAEQRKRDFEEWKQTKKSN